MYPRVRCYVLISFFFFSGLKGSDLISFLDPPNDYGDQFKDVVSLAKICSKVIRTGAKEVKLTSEQYSLVYGSLLVFLGTEPIKLLSKMPEPYDGKNDRERRKYERRNRLKKEFFDGFVRRVERTSYSFKELSEKDPEDEILLKALGGLVTFAHTVKEKISNKESVEWRAGKKIADFLAPYHEKKLVTLEFPIKDTASKK